MAVYQSVTGYVIHILTKVHRQCDSLRWQSYSWGLGLKSLHVLLEGWDITKSLTCTQWVTTELVSQEHVCKEYRHLDEGRVFHIPVWLAPVVCRYLHALVRTKHQCLQYQQLASQ